MKKFKPVLDLLLIALGVFCCYVLWFDKAQEEELEQCWKDREEQSRLADNYRLFYDACQDNFHTAMINHEDCWEALERCCEGCSNGTTEDDR